MRYLPLTDDDRAAMLAVVGASSIDDLYRHVPTEARIADGTFDLPSSRGEIEVERALGVLAAKNLHAGQAPSFLGAGLIRHHVPAALDHLIQRGEFLTAYTPYQPEISQGTLQALFEFQTQTALLTGMEVANASMYDGATACAEAAAMACRITGRKKILLSGSLHPQYAETTETFLRHGGVEVEALPPDPLGMEDLLGRIDDSLAAVVVQNPGFFGRVQSLCCLSTVLHDHGGLLAAVVAEPLALGMMVSPGEMGADVVVAEGQGLAGPLSFGGPGVGLFAARRKHVRHMPGRLCGQTVDVEGRRGFVLTLSTREQHIRREKAASNICTNSGLVALAFSIHLTLLGEAGFARLAQINHALAVKTAERIAKIKGVRIVSQTFFNEFAVALPKPAALAVEALAAKGILAGVPASRFYPEYPELADILLVAVNELVTAADVETLAAGLEEVLA